MKNGMSILQPLSGKNILVLLKKKSDYSSSSSKKIETYYSCFMATRGIFNLLATSLSLQLSKNLRIISIQWIQWFSFQKFSICSHNTLELAYKKCWSNAILPSFGVLEQRFYLECLAGVLLCMLTAASQSCDVTAALIQSGSLQELNLGCKLR